MEVAIRNAIPSPLPGGLGRGGAKRIFWLKENFAAMFFLALHEPGGSPPSLTLPAGGRGIGLLLILLSVLSLPAHAVTIEEVTGPQSGVKAWLVEDHKLPIIALNLAFEGGSEQDPVDRQGLATLTADALTEGAGTYDATAFQHELADHSIALGLSAERIHERLTATA